MLCNDDNIERGYLQAFSPVQTDRIENEMEIRYIIKSFYRMRQLYVILVML